VQARVPNDSPRSGQSVSESAASNKSLNGRDDERWAACVGTAVLRALRPDYLIKPTLDSQERRCNFPLGGLFDWGTGMDGDGVGTDGLTDEEGMVRVRGRTPGRGEAEEGDE
jgi:hypothetical protein